MTIFLETATVPAGVAAVIMTKLHNRVPFQVPDGEIAWGTTLTFRDGFQMDVTVVNCTRPEVGGPWVDYQLFEPFKDFKGGHWDYRYVECGPYEDRNTKLLDTFELWCDGHTYIGVLAMEEL